MDGGRRRLLGGRVREGAVLRPIVRPQWSGSEDRFTDRCTRCDDCIKVCPNHLIRRGTAGFPVLDFTQAACTFCAECVRVCTVGALVKDDSAPPWNVVADIGDTCLARRKVECRICGEACDAGAIRFRPTLGGVSQPALDSVLCTGCGACVAPCPTHAIACRPSAALTYLEAS